MTNKKTITKIIPYRFITIKTDAGINNTQKFSSYLRENELCSKNNTGQLVLRGEIGQSMLIVAVTLNIQTHSVGKMQNLLMIAQLVHIFTTGLRKFMRVDICHLSISAVDIIYMHLRSLFVICFGPFLALTS
jgi:hypothetical protein